MPSSLAAFWAGFQDEAPHAHPDDLPILERQGMSRELRLAPLENFDAAIGSQDFCRDPKRFWFSLLPAPYVGDLERADVFLLLLNPGFAGPADLYAEYRRPEWRARVLGSLRQRVQDLEFPNHCLDPHFAWTPGFMWMERRLSGVAASLAETCGGYVEALRILSRRICVVELVAYHSRTFAYPNLLDTLPSARAAKAFVHEELMPRARCDEISVILMRQAREWKLREQPQFPGFVRYEGGHTRGASLGPDTPGGKEILRRLRVSDARAF